MNHSVSVVPILSDRAATRDLIDFAPYTRALLDIVRDPNTATPITIGLFGVWGSGKTSLMKFVHYDLQSDPKNKFRLAWFDAWKYEREDALWRALLFRVIDNLRERDAEGRDVTDRPFRTEIEIMEQRLYRGVELKDKGKLTVDLPKLAKGSARGAMQIALSMLPGFGAETVKTAQEALGTGKDIGIILDALQRDGIQYYQDQLRSIEQFQNEFENLIAKHVVARGQRLIVFIDDLDRCLPEKAIEALEAIKLFLDVEGCIFILGMDQDVVARGIQDKYRAFGVNETGSGNRIPIDGAQYLEKIIQLPFRLPKIEPRAMQPFVHVLAAFPDSRCESVFAEGLETNPRKVKRAINVFLFISKLAEKRDIKLQSVRLAKIVVIYHSHPELYEMLRLNPALLRDLEAYLRQQASAPREADRGVRMERVEMVESVGQETSAAPVPARLITNSLKRVLTLFLEDDAACFLKADYAELASYFTLTRATIAETASVAIPESATRVALAFPVPTFVAIPAGEFLMGTSGAEIEKLARMRDAEPWARKLVEKGYFSNEEPQRRIMVDEFRIGKYPITNGEYQAFVKDAHYQSPSHWSGAEFPEELEAHPVISVSWDDAIKYCEWLTRKLRDGNAIQFDEVVRLTTEVEWEKAAAWDNATKQHRIWPWGNEWDSAKCNTAEGNMGRTTPVGEYSPSGNSFYGVADMVGNVWEWCGNLDRPQPPYLSLQENDAKGPRALRGGSWFAPNSYARCAFRFGSNPDSRQRSIGFRVALSKATEVLTKA